MKKMLILFSVSMLFIACEAPTGEQVEYSKMCDVSNNDKIVETDGYLVDKLMIRCSNVDGTSKCGLQFMENIGDEKSINVDIPTGNFSNTMSMPEKGYEKGSLTIRDNEGNNITLTKKVKLTGKLRVTKAESETDQGVCYMSSVYKIEQ